MTDALIIFHNFADAPKPIQEVITTKNAHERHGYMMLAN
jgi:hypothetical protein